MSKQLVIYIYNRTRCTNSWTRSFEKCLSQGLLSLDAFLRMYCRVFLFFMIGCFFFVCCYVGESLAMNRDGATGPSHSQNTSSSGNAQGGSGGNSNEGFNSSGESGLNTVSGRLDQQVIVIQPPPAPERSNSCSNICCCPSCLEGSCCDVPCPRWCTQDSVTCCVLSSTVCGTAAASAGFLGFNGSYLGAGVCGSIGCIGGGVLGAVCGVHLGHRVCPPLCSCVLGCLQQCENHCPNCKKNPTAAEMQMTDMGVQTSDTGSHGDNATHQSSATQPTLGESEENLEGPTSIYPQGELAQLRAGYSNNGGEPGGHTHSASPNLPITTQPSPGGLGGIGKKADLLSGYHPGAHMSSLTGMQHVLVTTSDYVLNTLKVLALRAYETTTETIHAAQQGSVGGSVLRKHSSASVTSMSALQCMQSFRPYTFFGGTDQYRSNLENKVRSGMAGLMLNPTSGLSVGVSYNRHYDEGQEQQGMRVGLSTGSAKAKTILDGLSMVVAWNTEAAGFTGHVASCCGWGNAKTTRNVVHGGKDVILKGRPDVSLRGGAAQFGYNVQNKYLSCTPYIECLVSRVAWDPYTEVSGKLPCAISRNKEQIVEQNIGLRKSWKMNETATVQVWVAEVFGRRKTNTLTSRPSLAPLSRYEVSVPMHKRRYIRTEFGTSYRAQLTEVFMLNVDGRFRRSMKGTLDDHNMSLNLHYSY